MPVATQQDSKTFRVAIFPTFAAIATLGFALYLLLVVSKDGFRGVNISALLFGTTGLVVTGLVFSLLIAWCFTVKLSHEGVSGHSAWGIRRSIRWEEIAATKPFRFFNLRYLRLYPRTGRAPVWIALFQARKAEFENELMVLAPPNNPVRGWLATSSQQ